MKGLKQADWIGAAHDFLAQLPADELKETTAWKVMDCFRIGRFIVAEDLLLAEKMRRGLVTMLDLTPDQRRRVVKPENLDLHSIASGPIMDAGEIYLPAGKLSMAETRAREQGQILPASGMEARRAAAENTDAVHDSPTAESGDAQ